MEKILVVQTAFPGDAILTLPAIQHLKEKNPDSEIDVVANPQTEEIFHHSKSVNRVYVLDKKKSYKKFSALKKFAIQLQQGNYSKIFSFHRSLRSSLLTYFTRVRDTVGFETSSFSFLYDTRRGYDTKIHEALRNIRLVDTDFNGMIPPPQIYSTDAMKDEIQNYLNENKLTNFIALAPGSVWETKKYPREKFLEIIEWCSQKNIQVCLIGSGAEVELCSQLSANGANVFNAAGKFSIVGSVELLRHAAVLVTNDSAPTHMGMAANIPVITIYCSTVPEFGFYPYNQKSSFVSLQGIFCKPCGIHGHDFCPLGSFKCGNDLSSRLVINDIEKILNDTGRD